MSEVYEDEYADWDVYCDCGCFHDEEEMAFNVCSACGRPLE